MADRDRGNGADQPLIAGAKIGGSEGAIERLIERQAAAEHIFNHHRRR